MKKRERKKTDGEGDSPDVLAGGPAPKRPGPVKPSAPAAMAEGKPKQPKRWRVRPMFGVADAWAPYNRPDVCKPVSL